MWAYLFIAFVVALSVIHAITIKDSICVEVQLYITLYCVTTVILQDDWWIADHMT